MIPYTELFIGLAIFTLMAFFMGGLVMFNIIGGIPGVFQALTQGQKRAWQSVSRAGR